ncbi:MAG: UDP-N-acetylmuramoyl-tripeptide--D-alanyl-D-alanine ligase [Ignavibacteria bacterium]|nr:UDP-N-acetylmuramoyl-tripeptide--D-alanyl-D-alanine ligase [Ignavibacteria bacterium]
MKLTISDFRKISNVNFINKDLIKPIKGISIDSRKINEGDLFFAIKGENFDGHDFVEEVFSKGASGAVIEKSQLEKFADKKFPLVVVDDTIKALGELANVYRKKFNLKLIGLTGSNGKTTTKEMIAKVLSSKFNTLKTEGNLNNNIGVPLNLFRLEKNHEFAVIEMGINHFNEMRWLCEIADPDYGLITNIGTAHIEFLGSREGIAKEKGELFQYLRKKGGFVFVNSDEKLIKDQAKGIKRKLTFGFNSKADVKGKIVSINNLAQPSIQVKYKGKSEIINLPTFGVHTAQNALCAIAVGLKFGISLKQIKKELETFQSYDKRMQVIEVGDYTIINDAYNANPDSMKAAIQTLSLMKGFQAKVAALGDMLELGNFSETFHRELAHYLCENKIDYSFFFGELTRHSFDEAKRLNLNARFFDDKKSLANEIKNSVPKGSLILLKGSRKMKMEEIIEYLKG